MYTNVASRSYSFSFGCWLNAWNGFSRAVPLFVLCFFSLAVFSAPAEIGTQKRAEALTQSLSGLNRAYQNAAPGARASALEELLSVAAERHDLLAGLIEGTPGALLELAIPASLRAGMPEEVYAFIEQRISMDGELEVLYEDYEDGSHRLRHFLKAYDERISLHFKAHPPALASGTAVAASGVYLAGVGDGKGIMALESGNNLLVLALDGEPSGGSPGETFNTIGEQTVAVLLVNFLNNFEETVSVSSAHELIFTTVESYMRETSSGETWLSGQVYGWYNLPIDQTCVASEISSAAQQAAVGRGVDLSQYSRIIYMFPLIGDCGWIGMGTVGGIPSETWINGKFELGVVGHELGHNYGLDHSNSLECGAEIQGSDCTSQEYGDDYDIMGSKNAAHYNAFQKERLGWLDSAGLDIVDIDSSGLYTLDVFEQGHGTRALKIPKELDSLGRQVWYYLEYRQALGADAFLATYDNVIGGILIHTGVEQDTTRSQLLDMTPGSYLYTDWYDPALAVGSVYEDKAAGLSISVTAADSSGAQVNIILTEPGGGDPGGGEPVNQLPVAVADFATTPTNTRIIISVLDNDYDPDGQALSVQFITQPANGTASVNANGSIEYKPRRKYSGTDSFSYEITDGIDTASAMVTVTVAKSSGGGKGGGGGGKGKGKS